MALFEAAFARVLTLCGALCGLVVVWVAVSISLDLALRSLDLGNIPWLNEVTEYLLYAGTFLGAPWALRLGAHVRVDLLESALPRDAARRLEQMIDVLGFVISAVLFWYGSVAVRDAVVSGAMQYKMLATPEWLLLLPFALSMLLLSIEFGLRFLRARDATDRDDAAPDEAGPDDAGRDDSAGDRTLLR